MACLEPVCFRNYAVRISFDQPISTSFDEVYLYTIRIHSGSRHETLLQPFKCFEFYEVNLPLACVSNVSILIETLSAGFNSRAYSVHFRLLHCKSLKKPFVLCTIVFSTYENPRLVPKITSIHHLLALRVSSLM